VISAAKTDQGRRARDRRRAGIFMFNGLAEFDGIVMKLHVKFIRKQPRGKFEIIRPPSI
jgi:hypothetical protein